MATSGRLITLLLFALALVVSSFAVSAQAPTGGIVNINTIANKPQYFTSTGDLLSHATFEGKFAASTVGPAPVANSLFYKRPITFSKATVAALARKRLKNAIPYVGQALLIKELFDEASLFVNATGDINSNPGSFFTTSDGAWVCADLNNSGPNEVCFDTLGAFMGQTWGPCVNCGGTQYLTITSLSPLQASGGGYIRNVNSANVYGSVGQQVQSSAATVATDDEVVNALKTKPVDKTEEWMRQAWAEPFVWPSGTPVIANPMPAVMAQVATQYRADTGVALAAGTADKTYADETAVAETAAASATSGTVTNPTPTANAAASASVDFPVFCTWASSVCTALDWITDTDVETPADQALPEVDIPMVEQTFNSGLGPGSCPGAIEVNFEFNGTRTVAFSYQPLCDFAILINPLILLLGAITAAWIISGKGMKSA